MQTYIYTFFSLLRRSRCSGAATETC